jgi:diguanylate cyclase (GGDEF)-like protein/PAS domain S-box-containing protein
MKKINKDLLKNITALYIEDEDIIREEVAFFFERYIGTFRTAANGLEGLEVYKEINPDIIITDIQMPKMNGLDMIKKLNDPNIPIIITTAYSDIEFFLQAIELNINRFVIKPIDLKDLLFDVQDCIVNLRLKDRLYEKENLLKIIDENVLISITDKKGEIIDASHSFCELTGYLKEELIGNTHNILKHEDTPDAFYENMWREINQGKIFKSEIKNKKKNGDTYWTDLSITPVFNNENKIENFTAIRQDVTNKKRLELLAIEDETTKLYNRRYFNNVIEKEIRRIKRENSSLSVMSIDIDFFKKYNDRYGHPKGDNTLIEVANVLKRNISRASDYSFRMGGEEFCIIFSGSTIEESLDFANDIVKEVENLNILHEDSTCSDFVTISAGIVVLSADNIVDAESVYKYSDDALYEAKHLGKNRLCLSTYSK